MPLGLTPESARALREFDEYTARFWAELMRRMAVSEDLLFMKTPTSKAQPTPEPEEGPVSEATQALPPRRRAKAQLNPEAASDLEISAAARAFCGLYRPYKDCETDKTHPPPFVPDEAAVAAEVRDLARVFRGRHPWVEANKDYFRFGFLTDPVTLDDEDGNPHPLGRFDVKVTVAPTPEGYRKETPVNTEVKAVAREPNPAAANDHVTHPHVSDAYVCLGDATEAVFRAARAGRLCDVLDVVDSVLRTYNPRSPHRRLESWNGLYCDNCDNSDARQIEACDGCEGDVCDECRYACDECGGGHYCRRCYRGLATAEDRGGNFCKECILMCVGCGCDLLDSDICESCRKRYCEDCLTYADHDLDADGRCEACAEKAAEDDDEDDEEGGDADRPDRPRCSRCARFQTADRLSRGHGLCPRCEGQDELEAVAGLP